MAKRSIDKSKSHFAAHFTTLISGDGMHLSHEISASRSIVEMFCRRVQESGDAIALKVPRDGEYSSYTWNEIASDVRRVALFLSQRGVEQDDRVATYAANTYHWILADLGIQMACGVHVPLHRDLSTDQAIEQTLHCGAKLLLTDCEQEDFSRLDSLEAQGAERVAMESPAGRPAKVGMLLDEQIATLDEQRADQMQPRAIDQLSNDDLATILYTSGTTGEPKGVMLTHGNLLSNTLAIVKSYALEESDVRLNFLPFSHIFARTCDLYTWIAAGHQLALTECRERIIANARHIQPTIINGVPFFYDKIHRKLTLHTGTAEEGRVQKILGGKVRGLCTGGAAMSPVVEQFFEDQGLTVYQGYGLTESSPVISVSSEDEHKIGAAGKPLDGVEVKIADDGEILARGPNIMVGYWNDAKATRQVLREGWLRTGDLGEIDQEGFLTITGRKKEIIVTAAGQNIAPTLVENCLTQDPLILQAMVIGENRNCLGALIVPDPDALRAEIKKRRLIVWSKRRAVTHPKIVELYRQRINERLAHLSHHEQVGPFKMLDRGFTPETGELTPSLKMRRDVIERNFAAEVDSLYPLVPDTSDGTSILPSWAWPFGGRT